MSESYLCAVPRVHGVGQDDDAGEATEPQCEEGAERSVEAFLLRVRLLFDGTEHAMDEPYHDKHA